VCSTNFYPVSAKDWDTDKFVKLGNATCPKNPSLFTKEMFCQASPWFIPCSDGLECPSTTKLCYSICTMGGTGGVHKFLGANQCQTENPEKYCKSNPLVASEADSALGKCVGMSYFEQYYMLSIMAQAQFQPRACRGRFPIFNKQMVNFNADMRVTFMKSLAKKLNRLWGYSDNADPYKFKRPVNVRLRRVQLLKGEPQVQVEMKEFCLSEFRKGAYDPSLKYNQDAFCDKVSVSPETVFKNLTALLDKKRPDRGMLIGEFNIRKSSKPGWPTKCFTYQPEEAPAIPRWVWPIVTLACMAFLLSLLILQHKFRNRASYVRLNEKLRSYV